MKKIYIAMAVLATAALTSCEQEQAFDEISPVGENGIAFTIDGGSSTRAAEVASEPEHGVSIPVGTDNEGNSFFLEETIEYLNPSPATKGAPAYTVNVGKLYTTMGVYSAAENIGDAEFEVMDTEMYDNPNGGKGWRYHHNYSKNPWPEDKTTPVDFYLRMPASDSEISDLTYGDKIVSFHYASSLTGKDQKDLLFGFTSLSKEKHDGYLPKGAPVMMHHALTGVKFRVGNDNTGSTKTIITKVSFTGLYGSGNCDITSTGTITWKDRGTNGVTFEQEYENPDYVKTQGANNSDGSVGFTKPTTGDAPFGDSWYSAANDKNLNNEAGELTFWFIPQAITESVKLEVTFCIKTPDTPGSTGGGMITHTIDFGSVLAAKNVVWNAGELRTYTLEPKDVDVAIVDEMDGWEKDDLHVANTGNVDEYVRVMVIGNWYDQEGNILVGYKTATGDEMVTPWFREDEVYGSYFDPTFTGGKPQGNNPWKRGTGSYFYYPTPIGAGKTLSGTQALFQSYKLPESAVPEVWIPSGGSGARVQAQGVHLVMEVVVQAIGATKPNSTENYDSCWDAWSAATGEKIVEKP